MISSNTEININTEEEHNITLHYITLWDVVEVVVNGRSRLKEVELMKCLAWVHHWMKQMLKA